MKQKYNQFFFVAIVYIQPQLGLILPILRSTYNKSHPSKQYGSRP